jgi:hypothetical protein
VKRAWGMRDRQIKPGTWLISLALLANSPPTYLDSRLVIEDYAHTHPGSPTPRSLSPDASPPPSPPGPSRLVKKTNSWRNSMNFSDTNSILSVDPEGSNRRLSNIPREASSSSIPTSTSTLKKQKTKPKPTISIRIKPTASMGQLAPPELCDDHSFRNEIVVPFNDSLMASSLQYE